MIREFKRRKVGYSPVGWWLIVILGLAAASCTQLEQPEVEPFFAVTQPPIKQELRWANGRSPKGVDPAFAVAAPETDLVRAIYEGLTELDSRTLQPVPAVAERWESADSMRTWIFHLRSNARWSNGQRVTARHFVESWKRLARLKSEAANPHLFQNIVGMEDSAAADLPADFLQPAAPEVDAEDVITPDDLLPRSQLAIPPQPQPANSPGAAALPAGKVRATTAKFGVEAINDATLKVSLILPDKDFPKLVASTVFRPVLKADAGAEVRLDPHIVTNGPFYIQSVNELEIRLGRSDSYWNRSSVELESVSFVSSKSAESALDAYRKGDVDVVTNATFAPLALKLLAPYDDFRRTPYSALNFYEFNPAVLPFSDRRVREAMAIAIDRAKLTDGDLEGTTQPALKFFPLSEGPKEQLALDTVKAKQLLEKAGYPDGVGFPPVRLVINRNDVQQRVARSVARMWKENLNIETVITVKETSEMEQVRAAGEFDLIRRGVVLSTTDEMVNITAVLGSAKNMTGMASTDVGSGEAEDLSNPAAKVAEGVVPDGGSDPNSNEGATPEPGDLALVLTEEDAVYDLKAIPLYFPMSYSLVKPYVHGFETNGLDAPSLLGVSINSDWRARQSR